MTFKRYILALSMLCQPMVGRDNRGCSWSSVSPEESHMRKVLLAVTVLLVATVPAFAQDHPVGFNLGGGWAFPTSGLNDAFDTGWNGTVGVTLNITPTLGFLTEYMYNRLGGPDRTIQVFPGPSPVGGSNQL